MTATPRPDYPIVDVDAIPHELIDDQWTGWKWAWRDGKWTKPPVNTRTGAGAKANDPTTWVSFEEAWLYAQQRRGGIGRFFHADDPYFGVDFDDCRDPETGVIEPWALDRIRALGTYAEVSPSGTGIKGIGRGRIPGERRRTGQIEMYDSERYFTFTGQPLEGYEQIIDCQDALDAFYTETFPAPAPAAPRPVASLSIDDRDIRDAADRINPKFPALWSGNADGYPSHSEARSALVYILAGYTKDPAQIERLFQSSGLYREDKWPRERDRLIDTALRDVTWQYEPPRARTIAPQTATSGVSASSQTTNEATFTDEFVASTDGEACGAERAQIAELELQLAAMTAERDGERERRITAEKRHSDVIQIIDNPTYTPTEAVAYIRAQFEYERLAAAGKTDGKRATLYLPELTKGIWFDRKTGEALDRDEIDHRKQRNELQQTAKLHGSIAPSTISRALKTVAERSGAFVIAEMTDPKTGKTRLTMEPVEAETMAAVAHAFVKVDRRRGPGRATPKDPRLAAIEPCKECGPDTDVVIKADAYCTSCGDHLGALPEERIAAPFQIESVGTASSDVAIDVLETNKLKRDRPRGRQGFWEARERHFADQEPDDDTSFEVETVEQSSPTDLCRGCGLRLFSAEERAFGRHDYDCTKPAPVHRPVQAFVAGGDD